ncbi:hypothetical protein TeGR_g9403 [Tetraparma gracilis]|uniref:BTB domain-containing protein n=1 Tax=Tetraparma gracilis TaxID=2962635 RepID=A0ABQ6MP67_9STRA|nr:hypothetical protein TeGR_g9403 [Tetraparma gracilis]
MAGTDESPLPEPPSFSFGSYGSRAAASPSTKKLSWRLPADESLSDWTLKVKNLDTNKVDTYHVHKATLCVGPRMCEFFKTMMMGNQARFREKAAACTEMELNGLAAAAFPAFLDFLYDPVGDIAIESSTACALFHLSDFLGCEEAFRAVGDFIERDIADMVGRGIYKSSVGCIYYMLHATAFQQDKLVEMAVECFADCMGMGYACAWGMTAKEMNEFGKLTADLMCALCTHPKFTRTGGNRADHVWSRAVGIFCRAQPEAVTLDFFAVVAKEGVIGTIADDEILFFLAQLDVLDKEESGKAKKRNRGEKGKPHATDFFRELCYATATKRLAIDNVPLRLLSVKEDQTWLQNTNEYLDFMDISELTWGAELAPATLIELLQRFARAAKKKDREMKTATVNVPPLPLTHGLTHFLHTVPNTTISLPCKPQSCTIKIKYTEA